MWKYLVAVGSAAKVASLATTNLSKTSTRIKDTGIGIHHSQACMVKQQDPERVGKGGERRPKKELRRLLTKMTKVGSEILIPCDGIRMFSWRQSVSFENKLFLGTVRHIPPIHS